MVRAGGAVVAFAEGRKDSLADDGDIDVVARRSLDGGCTWGPLRVVADMGRDTIGNPAPVVHPGTGRLTLLTSRNEHGVMAHRRVYVQHSDDAGRTFSTPREITGQVKPDHWNWYGTGPGHAIALRHGPHAGRLLVPGNHSYLPPGSSAYRSGAHALYSDDAGTTWHLGYVAQPSGDALRLSENTLTELPDGRIYTNVRDDGGTAPATRADAYLAPGGGRLLSPYRPEPGLTGPVVQGSTLWAGDRLVYSGPADPGARRDLTLRVSTDHGHTWHPGPRLTSGPSAYSDLVLLAPDTLGVLHEAGTRSPYESLTLTRVPVSQLTG
ncbi:sialidase family protein [Streptomyces sp. JJ66]|uniref:sialidase family protein n=1 Tax=Streptomyces sp. JJ66 TaxID=2803843 RepID=UPI0027E21E9E|nr:sialidase family protein [Streptomyces sp. JJ66]